MKLTVELAPTAPSDGCLRQLHPLLALCAEQLLTLCANTPYALAATAPASLAKCAATTLPG